MRQIDRTQSVVDNFTVKFIEHNEASRAMAAISPDLEQFVQQEVASGRFVDRDAVIAHALALFQRDREEAVAGIEAGMQDVTARRVQPLHVAFDELRRELGVREGS